MWWSRKIRAFLAACVAAIMLAACTDGDFYSDAQYGDIGKVRIETGSSRIEQLYHRRLQSLLARHGREEELYTLTISLDAVSGEDSVVMSAGLELYDTGEGVVVTRKNIDSSASIGATRSLYGAEEARRFARERLATNLADKTYHYLVVYFARQNP